MTERLRSAALASLILATIIAVYDQGMVNLALPVIAADLNVPLTDALWLSRANLVACALCILPSSALGDILGHRRMLVWGLALVVASAVGCALASSLSWMLLLRTAQGAGAAAIMCSTLVLITAISPRQRLGRAIGINALFIAVTSTVAPALTGLLLHWLSWRWLFVTPLALGVPALCLAFASLPHVPGVQRRFDGLGASLLMALLALCLSTAYAGLPAPLAWLGGGILGAAFVHSQRNRPWALLPLSVLGNRSLSSALLASCLAFIGQSTAYILLPVMLQGPMAYSPLASAGVFIAWPLMTALTAPLAGRGADRYSSRSLALAGTLVLSLGLTCLGTLPALPTGWDIAWRMGLCGIGFGLFQSPNNRGILLGVDPAHAAKAAALISLARLSGQALGVLLVGAILAQGTDGTSAMRTCMGVVLALQVLGVTVLATTTKAATGQTRSAH